MNGWNLENSIIEDRLYDVNPVSYFDFPQSALAFCESQKTSIPLYDNGCLFRSYGKTKTLVTFAGLEELFEGIEKHHPKKVLAFCNKGITGKYAGKDFYCDYWNTEEWLNTKDNKRKYAYYLRRADKEWELTDILKREEVLKVFDDWAERAQSRHFMVIKGHYLAYIERYFRGAPIHLIGIKNRNTGKLEGVSGYEISHKKAGITVMKNTTIKNRFTDWFWIRILEHIQKEYHPKIIFCGSTADKLKLHLGLPFWKSYKIQIKERK